MASPVVVSGDLQDGMLAHYLEQAKASDVNVEARIEREPFDFRIMAQDFTIDFDELSSRIDAEAKLLALINKKCRT